MSNDNQGGARSTDPHTSHLAAASFDPTALEMEVLRVVRGFELGCIADEVEMLLPSTRSHSVTPRFAPLKRKGLIVDTGRRKKAASGRLQIVVMATAEGMIA